MASAAGTLTGRVGPGIASAAISFSSLERIELDFIHQTGRIEWNTAAGENKFMEWDLSLTTTFTDTITSFVHALTVSGT